MGTACQPGVQQTTLFLLNYHDRGARACEAGRRYGATAVLPVGRSWPHGRRVLTLIVFAPSAKYSNFHLKVTRRLHGTTEPARSKKVLISVL